MHCLLSRRLCSHIWNMIWYIRETKKMCSQFNRCIRKEQKLKHERRWSNLLSLSLSLRKLGNWRCELCHFTKEIVYNVYRNALALPMAATDALAARCIVTRACMSFAVKPKTPKRLLQNVLRNISIFVHRLLWHCAWSLSVGPLFAIFWRKARQSQRIDCQWANARLHNKWSKWK